MIYLATYTRKRKAYDTIEAAKIAQDANPHNFSGIQVEKTAFCIQKLGWNVPEDTFVSADNLGLKSAYFKDKESALIAAQKLPIFGSDFGKGWQGSYRVVSEEIPEEWAINE